MSAFIADTVSGTILAAATIGATPERIFQALTDSSEVVRWWGSDDVYRTTNWVMDPHAGEAWRAEGKGADGSSFSIQGTVMVAEACRHLEFTWESDFDPGQSTTVAYTLEAVAHGTRLTVRHDGFVNRPDACRSHAEGWGLVLRWLEAYVAPARFFCCRLITPRATFAQDMTPNERVAMQQHVAYWTQLLRDGKAIVFGPVGDPAGPWGLAVVRLIGKDDIRTIEANDPAIRAQIGMRYEILPMVRAIIG